MSASRELRCPKCDGEMELGHVRDRMNWRTSRPAEWIAGAPEVNWAGSLKVTEKRRYVLASARCVDCGYVELYAKSKLPVAGFFGLQD